MWVDEGDFVFVEKQPPPRAPVPMSYGMPPPMSMPGGIPPPVPLKRQNTVRSHYPRLRFSRVAVVAGKDMAAMNNNNGLHQLMAPPTPPLDYAFNEELAFMTRLETRNKALEAQRAAREARLAEDLKKQEAEEQNLREVLERSRHELELQEKSKKLEEELMRQNKPAEPVIGYDHVVFPKPLSPEETKQLDTLRKLQAVVGSRDDAKCKELLGYHNYNLENAVSAYFDHGSIDAALAKHRQNGGARSPPPAPVQKTSAITVQLPNGAEIRATFRSEQTLWDVYSFVSEHAAQWGNAPFQLMQASPKTLYDEQLMNLSLDAAGLYPEGKILAVLANNQRGWA